MNCKNTYEDELQIDHPEHVRTSCSRIVRNEAGLTEVSEIHVYIRFVHYNALIEVFENEHVFYELHVADPISTLNGIREF